MSDELRGLETMAESIWRNQGMDPHEVATALLDLVRQYVHAHTIEPKKQVLVAEWDVAEGSQYTNPRATVTADGRLINTETSPSRTRWEERDA